LPKIKDYIDLLIIIQSFASILLLSLSMYRL
jgi:hypothetical protein